MKVTVKRIFKADVGQMEQKINSYLTDPANTGSSVAAAFETESGDVIVVFQKP